MIVVNPDFKQLQDLAWESSVRAVVMGPHIALAPAMEIIHAGISQKLQAMFGVQEPYLEFVIDSALVGYPRIDNTGGYVEGGKGWRAVCTPQQQDTLDDLTRLMDGRG